MTRLEQIKQTITAAEVVTDTHCTIRARIRARIAERGLKITWLAEQAGIHSSALYAYLGGKRGIPYDVLEKLFRILEL